MKYDPNTGYVTGPDGVRSGAYDHKLNRRVAFPEVNHDPIIDESEIAYYKGFGRFPAEDEVVSHLNDCPWDNRQGNLYLRPMSTSSKGIYYSKKREKFRIRAVIDGVRTYLGQRQHHTDAIILARSVVTHRPQLVHEKLRAGFYKFT